VSYTKEIFIPEKLSGEFMNKIIFYNLEKNNVKLSIQAGTSYENAIETCKEFIATLMEDMATTIAQQELSEKKAAENAHAQELAEKEFAEREATDGSAE
jgi:hypothetical protein